MILLLRNGSAELDPGALCAFLLSSFLLSASFTVRLRIPALYIGLGKCLCLHIQSRNSRWKEEWWAVSHWKQKVVFSDIVGIFYKQKAWRSIGTRIWSRYCYLTIRFTSGRCLYRFLTASWYSCFLRSLGRTYGMQVQGEELDLLIYKDSTSVSFIFGIHTTLNLIFYQWHLIHVCAWQWQLFGQSQ